MKILVNEAQSYDIHNVYLRILCTFFPRTAFVDLASVINTLSDTEIFKLISV